jgi:hypothetical protein
MKSFLVYVFLTEWKIQERSLSRSGTCSQIVLVQMWLAKKIFLKEFKNWIVYYDDAKKLANDE